MKRLAIVTSVISGLLLVLGLVDYLTNYNWANNQGTLFGNPRIVMNEGATVLIAGGLLTIGAVVMWVVAVRKGRGDQNQS